jgi:hypothetical protein
MNFLVSPTEALLMTKTALALLFITAVGPHFGPTKFGC